MIGWSSSRDLLASSNHRALIKRLVITQQGNVFLRLELGYTDDIL